MKVYDQSLTGATSAGPARTQETQRTDRGDSTRAGGNGGGGGDRVELSGALGNLSRALAAFSSTRSSKVQSLAGLYQSGTYQPDAGATSRGMVADALAAGAK
jgi:hypothetical protein